MQRALLLGVVALALGPCDWRSKPEPDAPTEPGAAEEGFRQAPAQGEEAPSDPSRPEPDSLDTAPAPAEPQPARPPEGRTALVAKDHAFYDRLEGTSFENACERDADCRTAGCSKEICAAEADAVSTCEVLPVSFPEDASCGCVDGECQWFGSAGMPLGEPPSTEPRPSHDGTAPEPGQVRCGTEICKPGQTCLEWFGIAGPSGPRFQGCEWTCKNDAACPKGLRCVTIADGPGQVCR